MNNIQTSSMGFTLLNNVYIEVIDPKNKIITKRVKTHNKATRKMVFGLLNFLEGKFTSTDLNDNPQYDSNVVKQFIPCYFSVGDGGVILDESGIPQPIDSENLRIPKLENSWNEHVDYNSTKLIRELSFGQRYKIGKQSNTFIDTTGTSYNDLPFDMDSVYFNCQIGPNQLNQNYQNNPLYVTELGLFSSNIPNTEDLLAYVKLGNYIENVDGVDTQKTNALYVRPDDTIVIKWIISIAAIGKDSILTQRIQDETGQIITNDVTIIPTQSNIEIEIY